MLPEDARPDDAGSGDRPGAEPHRPPEILPEVRASDSDRAAVAERLRDAFVDGRLDEDEFDIRIHAALTARTGKDLEHLLDDLGVPPLPPRPAGSAAGPPAAAGSTATGGATVSPHGPGREHSWTIAVMSGTERKGRWRVPEQTSTVAFWGGASLDLRTATLTSQVTTIVAVAIQGWAEVIVPPGVRVEVSGFGLMGGVDDQVQDEDLPSNTPLVRVRWFALMGGVGVYTKRPGKKNKRRELTEE